VAIARAWAARAGTFEALLDGFLAHAAVGAGAGTALADGEERVRARSDCRVDLALADAFADTQDHRCAVPWLRLRVILNINKIARWPAPFKLQ
jgi:hypothetical protein